MKQGRRGEGEERLKRLVNSTYIVHLSKVRFVSFEQINDSFFDNDSCFRNCLGPVAPSIVLSWYLNEKTDYYVKGELGYSTPPYMTGGGGQSPVGEYRGIEEDI